MIIGEKWREVDDLYDRFNTSLGNSEKIFDQLIKEATRCMLDIHDVLDEIGTVKGVLHCQQSVWEQLHEVENKDTPRSPETQELPVSTAENRDPAEHGSVSGTHTPVIPLRRGEVRNSEGASDSSKPTKCIWDPKKCKTSRLKKNPVLGLAKQIESSAKELKEKVCFQSQLKIQGEKMKLNQDSARRKT